MKRTLQMRDTFLTTLAMMAMFYNLLYRYTFHYLFCAKYLCFEMIVTFFCQRSLLSVLLGGSNFLLNTGYNASSDSLGKFCGTKTPDYVSSGSYIMVMFISDYSLSSRGFKARYKSGPRRM